MVRVGRIRGSSGNDKRRLTSRKEEEEEEEMYCLKCMDRIRDTKYGVWINAVDLPEGLEVMLCYPCAYTLDPGLPKMPIDYIPLDNGYGETVLFNGKVITTYAHWPDEEHYGLYLMGLDFPMFVRDAETGLNERVQAFRYVRTGSGGGFKFESSKKKEKKRGLRIKNVTN